MLKKIPNDIYKAKKIEIKLYKTKKKSQKKFKKFVNEYPLTQFLNNL